MSPACLSVVLVSALHVSAQPAAPTHGERAHPAPSAAPPVEQEAPKEAPSGPRWQRAGFGFGGVPALGYDPDGGVLFGVVGYIYRYDGATAPYRESLGFQLLMTHKLVQDHKLVLDALRVLDLPLRLNALIGFAENLGQNYCGTGADVTCAAADADAAATTLGLEGEARAAFLRRYYVFPFIAPNGSVALRWRLNDPADKRLKVEVAGGWRGARYIPGTIFDDDGDGRLDLFPYAHSRYAADFPGGEPGFASVVQLGAIVDRRDNEPSPRHGWLVEGSVRGAHPALGSTWEYYGANVTLRGYAPVVPGSDRLVVAMRLILDGVVGDLPVLEMARIGGSVDYSGFGGVDLGRGIRGQRYLGRVKVLEQQELRWHFFEFDAAGQRFGLITNAFLDAGFVALAFDELGSDGPQLPIGLGGAFAISWNENFILRIDVAASSAEGFAPFPYITLGQSF